MFIVHYNEIPLVAVLTFSFLVVHKDFQDTITYEVDESTIFEDALVHICDRFGFYRNRVSVTSNLGMEIDDLRAQVKDIGLRYGYYFKLVIREPSETFTSTVSDKFGEVSSTEELVGVNRESALDGWKTTVMEEISPVSSTVVGNDIKEMLQEVINDLFQVHINNWSVDPEGYIEITVFPKLETYINQLRVDILATSSVKQLFTKVAFTCGFQLRELILVPLKEEAIIIEDRDISVLEIVETYGSIFLLYPKEIRSNLVSSKQILAQDVAEILKGDN